MINNNMLFLEQNIFTLSPLLFSVLIGLMVVTKKWDKEKNSMLFLVMNGVCTTLFLYGYLEEALLILDICAIVIVLYSLFKKRRSCNEKE